MLINSIKINRRMYNTYKKKRILFRIKKRFQRFRSRIYKKKVVPLRFKTRIFRRRVDLINFRPFNDKKEKLTFKVKLYKIISVRKTRNKNFVEKDLYKSEGELLYEIKRKLKLTRKQLTSKEQITLIDNLYCSVVAEDTLISDLKKMLTLVNNQIIQNILDRTNIGNLLPIYSKFKKTQEFTQKKQHPITNYIINDSTRNVTEKLTRKLTIDLVISGMLEMGEKLIKATKNNKIYKFYFGVRNKHAIYNVNKILCGLRLTLSATNQRLKYGKYSVVNHTQKRTHNTDYTDYKPIEKFNQNKFLVTWDKWIGGILTNFKRVSKRILLRMHNEREQTNPVDYKVAFPKDVPKLPGFLINITNNHWALNESKSMRLNATQLLEASHSGYFGDINLAINTHYFGLRVFSRLLSETVDVDIQEKRNLYKARLFNRVQYKIKQKARLFNRVQYQLKDNVIV